MRTYLGEIPALVEVTALPARVSSWRTKCLDSPRVLREINLIGANGGGSFPRQVKAELLSHHTAEKPADSILGILLELNEEHLAEIRSGQERFGQMVLAVLHGWGYRFKRLDPDGSFELEKNWP